MDEVVVRLTHRYRNMTRDMRPQDDSLDGSGLTFETLEHGGEFPDQFPNVIRVTDPAGRWCVYTPVREHGRVVQSLGFCHERERDDYL